MDNEIIFIKYNDINWELVLVVLAFLILNFHFWGIGTQALRTFNLTHACHYNLTIIDFYHFISLLRNLSRQLAITVDSPRYM